MKEQDRQKLVDDLDTVRRELEDLRQAMMASDGKTAIPVARRLMVMRDRLADVRNRFAIPIAPKQRKVAK